MPFKEKSAWIMLVALLASGGIYALLVVNLSNHAGSLIPPLLPTVFVYTVVLVALAILGHIVIAVMAPKDANAASDERDKQISAVAGHYSSVLLGVGVLMFLGIYLFSYNGHLLFYGIFGSLMLSQIAEYALQIKFYRS